MPEVLSRELEGITTQAAAGRARPGLPAPQSALGLPGLGNALGCSSALLTPKAAMRIHSVCLFVLISAHFLETGSRHRRLLGSLHRVSPLLGNAEGRVLNLTDATVRE